MLYNKCNNFIPPINILVQFVSTESHLDSHPFYLTTPPSSLIHTPCQATVGAKSGKKTKQKWCKIGMAIS